MKQRAKLAQAIVHDPDLVLLDEPTAGLDPEGREEMLDLVARLGGFGINVITSSHVLTDIEQTCDWVVMLDAGSVLRHGPLETLLDSNTVELELFDDPAPVHRTLQSMGADVTLNGSTLTVRVDGDDAYDVVRDALAASGVSIRRLGTRAQSLEDLFLRSEESAT